MDDEKLIKAINSIYNAALSTELWQTALEDSLAFLGREKGNIQYINPTTGSYEALAYKGFDGSYFDKFEELETYKYDVWAHAAGETPSNEILVTSRVVPEDVYLNSILYNDILKNFGLNAWDCMTGISGDRSIQFGIAAIYGNDDEEYFTQDEIDRYKLLWPHFEKALIIRTAMSELSLQRNLSAHLVDRLDYGLIGLDADHTVVYTNHKAAELLNAGEPLTQVNGKLAAPLVQDDKKLQQAIANAELTGDNVEASQATSLTLRSVNASRSWSLLVTPLQQQVEQLADIVPVPSITTLVKISDHNTVSTLRVEALKSACQLTSAEAELVISLMSGWTMSIIAQNAGRSVETLRTQLKSVFRKTNTNSQQELARFIMSLPV